MINIQPMAQTDFFTAISLPIQVNANILISTIQLSLSKSNPLDYFWKQKKP